MIILRIALLAGVTVCAAFWVMFARAQARIEARLRTVMPATPEEAAGIAAVAAAGHRAWDLHHAAAKEGS